MDVDKALETQIKNLQARAGKTLDELYGIIRKSSLAKHGQIRDLLKKDLGMGHGDANTVAQLYLKTDGGRAQAAPEPGADDALDQIYSGAKAALRPIHEKLMASIQKFGEFEIAPKKTYVSLRRKKQFAMIGPATQTRFEVGLNMKGVEATDRLEALPPGQMCQYKVKLTKVEEADAELIGWIKQAYDSAG